MNGLVLRIVFLVLLCNSCRSVQVNKAQALLSYPTAYHFKGSVEAFGDQFTNAYHQYHKEVGFYLEYYNYKNKSKRYKLSETQAKEQGLYGEKNQYDVWMRFSLDSSGVFFSKSGKPLKFIMECKAHVTQITPDSIRVAVEVFSSKLVVGRSIFPTPPHFVNNPIYKTVQPPAREQYKILRCFGMGLGVGNQMPELK